MGLATDTTINTGVMGISYNDGTVPNVVEQMVLQILINNQAYSIYLDDWKQAPEKFYSAASTRKSLWDL